MYLCGVNDRNMDILYKNHQKYLQGVNTSFVRKTINDIDWDNTLIGIKGAKGVGKTTMILQYIISTFGKSNKALYLSMDSLALKNQTIMEIAEYHINIGGTHLFIDEIHKYPEWSKDLKTTHDLFPDLHIVFTGSSMLQIYAGAADLSRRAVTYTMQGLSFREFLALETGENIEAYTLNDIINDHISIASDINAKVKVLPYFKQYIEYGYYPFYLQNKKSYHLKLENVINTTLEVDMPYVLGVNVQNIYKIKKLLHILAAEVPFQPNITKLSGSLELNKATLNHYLYYLEEAGLLNLLLDAGKGYSMLSKPEKIYLNNPNLSYCINPEMAHKGTIRELFFFNQVSFKHKINASDIGDFLVNEKYTFEVGGRSKNYDQIANIKDSFIVSDDIESGVKHKIPIWLFGLLY
jgi:uncharacterized protein